MQWQQDLSHCSMMCEHAEAHLKYVQCTQYEEQTKGARSEQEGFFHLCTFYASGKSYLNMGEGILVQEEGCIPKCC